MKESIPTSTDDTLSEVMYHWRVRSVHKMLEMQGKAEGPLSVADMSSAWTDWCRQRYLNFINEEAFNRDFFGDEIYEQRSSFYRSICRLFEGGNLGGIRITGKRT